MVTLVLASASPRRHELILLLSYPTLIIVPDVDEESIDHTYPAHNAVETARLKAEAAAASYQGNAVIVAADTTVAIRRETLGKPADAAAARVMLQQLRGRTHQVHTGIVVLTLPDRRSASAISTTDVTMRDYNDAEIEEYVASGDPLDKAGAYAIQNASFRPVATLDGCFTGVVGLSLCRLTQALHRAGVPVDLAVSDHDARRCQTCRALARDLL